MCSVSFEWVPSQVQKAGLFRRSPALCVCEWDELILCSGSMLLSIEEEFVTVKSTVPTFLRSWVLSICSYICVFVYENKGIEKEINIQHAHTCIFARPSIIQTLWHVYIVRLMLLRY